ncbi:MAG: hypothetical protein U9P71_00440 [Campylobacterota bacterium]|nr:hypothetical protein [Campylobacterota bacterium]
MEVQSYTFQSPYPSQMQRGKVVPQPEEQESSTAPKAEEIKDETLQKAELYSSGVSSASSVNVASSTTDSAVSSSLAEFTQINTQLQAEQAYSS